jgi:hypothetical protein
MITQVTEKVKLDELLDSYTSPKSKNGEFFMNDKKIVSRLVLYTPELAKFILDNFNEKNRPISKNNVNFLVKEVENGNWMGNGDSIRFNENFDLIDGSHRLSMILNTGVTIPFLTLSGFESDSFKSIDIGRKRTGSDVLAIEGIKNYTNTSATVKFIYAFKNAKYSANTMSSRTLTNTELIEYYNTLPHIDESVKTINKYADNCKGFIRPTLIAGFHYLMSEIDTKLADEFISKLCTGVGLEEDSPIVVLRNKLIKTKFDKNYVIKNEELLKIICYSWEKFITGKKIKTIKLPEEYEIKLVNP